MGPLWQARRRGANGPALDSDQRAAFSPGRKGLSFRVLLSTARLVSRVGLFKRLVSVCGVAAALTLGLSAASAQELAPVNNALPVQSVQTVSPLQDALVQDALATAADPATDAALPQAASLEELVRAVTVPAALSPELTCLAGAIYYEARSESLAGQLAVGRVIVARTASGRYPTSYCGVVLQRSQFSFVRGGAIPGVSPTNRLWQQAVRIAVIAARGAWKSPAEGALFFHAARIGPMQGRTRVARIDNHIFYR